MGYSNKQGQPYSASCIKSTGEGDVSFSFQLDNFALETRDLELLRLHLAMARNAVSRFRRLRLIRCSANRGRKKRRRHYC
jgi:hypothetical protein